MFLKWWTITVAFEIVGLWTLSIQTSSSCIKFFIGVAFSLSLIAMLIDQLFTRHDWLSRFMLSSTFIHCTSVLQPVATACLTAIRFVWLKTPLTTCKWKYIANLTCIQRFWLSCKMFNENRKVLLYLVKSNS